MLNSGIKSKNVSNIDMDNYIVFNLLCPRRGFNSDHIYLYNTNTWHQFIDKQDT